MHAYLHVRRVTKICMVLVAFFSELVHHGPCTYTEWELYTVTILCESEVRGHLNVSVVHTYGR